MDEFQSLNHTKWDCKYHVVFIPKGRKKALFGHLRQDLGGVFRRLAEQKESKIEEGHLLVDHVHMLAACGEGVANTAGSLDDAGVPASLLIAFQQAGKVRPWTTRPMRPRRGPPPGSLRGAAPRRRRRR